VLTVALLSTLTRHVVENAPLVEPHTVMPPDTTLAKTVIEALT
jgi:hypothetical protein